MMSDNENEKRETVADVVAEYRNDADAMDRGWLYQPTTEYVRRLLDRIEAAWKRESRAIATEHAVLPAVCITRPSGNAAAMRETLETIHDKVNGLDEECGVDPVEVRDLARAALSAPARNCDHFSSVEQARTVYCSECGRIISIWDGVESGLFEEWLFAPAAERKGEGDGR